ncbi:MAG: hypothetical protein ACO3FE_17150 [Planctomycetaceae bacterium]
MFWPLDPSGLNTVTATAVHPHPAGDVCMRPNNWEYPPDTSLGNGQISRAAECRSSLQMLAEPDAEGTEPAWRISPPVLRSPRLIAAELGIHFVFSED